MTNNSSDSLHICVLNKDELIHNKDAKFAPGIQGNDFNFNPKNFFVVVG